MSTATKAAAMRWFDKHAGRHIHTKWKRPSGWTTVDESRLLTKDGSAFRLDSSRFSDPRDKNTIVREVADDHVTLELQDGDGGTWQWITYTVIDHRSPR